MNPANKILKQIAMKFTSILIGLLLCSYSFGMNINQATEEDAADDIKHSFSYNSVK